METLPVYIKVLSILFLVAYLLSVGLETKRGEIAEVLSEPGLCVRSLVANLLLVPGLGLLLATTLDLSPDTRTGILMLAIAPGGLFALNFARIAKGDRRFAVALGFGLSVIAAVFTPLSAMLFVGGDVGTWAPTLQIAGVLILSMVVPLLAGRLLQQFASSVAPTLARICGVASIVLFMIVTVLTASLKSPALKSIGLTAVLAILVLVVASWAIGWFLGGPSTETRTSLAIATGLRNVGVCLVVAGYFLPHTDVSVPLLAFSALSVPMSAVFGFLIKRSHRSTEVRPAA